jgi:acetyltransferase-like isoleucine patch superfamily enzyme
MSTMRLRLVLLVGVAALPSFLKGPIYRMFFGYKIGKRVRIGFSILDANECYIADDVSIGHLNVFTGVKELSIGEHSRIGALNIFRGGDEIRIGRYCDILRLNEINSIPEPDVINEVDPRFIMGDGSMIAASHKIDFTDRVEFGSRVILGGRNSSIWTHNRQKTLPVSVGARTYLGSEVRIAPGVEIAANCIVGMGSVLTGKLSEEFQLIGGVPAKAIKPLDDDGRFLVERKTRNDLPDDI